MYSLFDSESKFLVFPHCELSTFLILRLSNNRISSQLIKTKKKANGYYEVLVDRYNVVWKWEIYFRLTIITWKQVTKYILTSNQLTINVISRDFSEIPYSQYGNYGNVCVQCGNYENSLSLKKFPWKQRLINQISY